MPERPYYTFCLSYAKVHARKRVWHIEWSGNKSVNR